ncbi:hypothetical protein pb186bvf_015505 [Paramecium bursaria]
MIPIRNTKCNFLKNDYSLQIYHNEDVAQWSELQAVNLEVGGSIPLIFVFYIYYFLMKFPYIKI